MTKCQDKCERGGTFRSWFYWDSEESLNITEFLRQLAKINNDKCLVAGYKICQNRFHKSKPDAKDALVKELFFEINPFFRTGVLFSLLEDPPLEGLLRINMSWAKLHFGCLIRHKLSIKTRPLSPTTLSLKSTKHISHRLSQGSSG